MDVLLVIDMQEGLLKGDPKRDLAGVVERINRLARRVRASAGAVVFVQHAGPAGDDFEPGSPGWKLLSALDVEPGDRSVAKTLNDAFFETSLGDDLTALRADRLLISGWATDFCVDATVRSAVALGFEVVIVADGHTLGDRPHLPADRVIEHHHWVWRNLIAPRPVTIQSAAEIDGGLT